MTRLINWDRDEVLRRLEELFQDPRTTFDTIAQTLNREFALGASRNAVIGKCRRMKLAEKYPEAALERATHGSGGVRPTKVRLKSVAVGRSAPPKPPRPGPNRGPAPPRDAKDIAEMIVPKCRLITIMDLKKDTCRYPIGHQPPYEYCGLLVASGHPYCGAHARIVYQEPVLRSRKNQKPMYR